MNGLISGSAKLSFQKKKKKKKKNVITYTVHYNKLESLNINRVPTPTSTEHMRRKKKI